MGLFAHIPAYIMAVGLCVLIITRTIRVIRNYNLVKHEGLPIVVMPWSWQDPLWMLFASYLLWMRHVPGFSWIRYSYMGWTTSDKGRAHRPPPEGLGPAFIVVSPGRTEFFTIDAQTAVNVSRNWREYDHPEDLYSVFDVFGQNVNSVNGRDWQRHRKVVGGAFREAIYPTVWDETKVQAKGMIDTFLEQSRCSLKDIRQGGELLAMHVLSAAAFGKKYAYGASGLKSVDPGHKLSYMDCMRTMYPSLMGVIFFGGFRLPVPGWMVPAGLRRIKEAIDEYKLYLLEAVKQEQLRGMSDQDKVPNLATLLVRANDVEKDQNLASGAMKSHLSDTELYGNMFTFNVAGYETTAMALSFVTPYLAVYPEAQQWAREEVDAVFREDDSLSYEDAYHRLPRVRALMYETLRLQSSVAHLPRQTPPYTTTIDVPSLNKTLTIPPRSLFSIPVVISGYLPTPFNGPDPSVFNPQRFVHVVDASSGGREDVRDDADLAKEGWMPWITGPRTCPGKKFSQVEFVGVVSALLRRTEVRVADWRGEGAERARQRLRNALQDTVFNLGVTIKGADQVGVEFLARS